MIPFNSITDSCCCACVWHVLLLSVLMLVVMLLSHWIYMVQKQVSGVTVTEAPFTLSHLNVKMILMLFSHHCSWIASMFFPHLSHVSKTVSLFALPSQCLEKFPVIQHFKFGSLLSIQPTKHWRSCCAHNGKTKISTVSPSSGILLSKCTGSKNQPYVVWHSHSHMFTRMW